MAMDISDFKIDRQQVIDLNEFESNETGNLTKERAADDLRELKAELFELQEKLYADNKKSLLIIFQAMDAAGKDSAIKHVMSGLNPQGCQVFSFKQPTSEELDHDFLWRHYKALPERGRIGIHNRSHYENVLVCKVHPAIAANESQLPLSEIDENFWKNRYRSIRCFEEHLSANGTRIIKFFLHISKAEQKKRFLKRIEDPSKNWKFSAADLEERELWNSYMEAYQTAISETGTQNAPWYIIPGGKKWFARTAICQIIVNTLRDMDLRYPAVSAEEKEALIKCKEILEKED